MVAWSLPAELVHQDCHVLLHTHTNSCLMSVMTMGVNACKGAAIFLTLIEIFQYIRKKASNRPVEKKTLKEILRSYIGFTTFVFFESCGGVGFPCLFRHILGRFRRLTFAITPGIVSGWAIAAIDPKLRLLCAFVFSNSAISLFFKRTEKTFKLSLRRKTLLFMTFSSVVSGLLAKLKNPSFQFFCSRPCRHPGSCARHILKDSASYLAAGLGLSLVKLLSDVKNFASLLKALQTLTHPKTFSLSVFFGLYSFVYQVTRCILRRLRKDDSYVYDSTAGAIAGLTFLVNPSLSFVNIAFITTIQILTRLGVLKGYLPDWPYSVIVFGFCNGLFFDAAFLKMDCPSLPWFAFKIATNWEAEQISKNISRVLIQK